MLELNERSGIWRKFQVHGLYYWLAIVTAIVVGSIRFGLLLHTWFQAPDSQPIPGEVYFWLVFASAFPIILHIAAGVAEVNLNRERRRRFNDKHY